MAKRKFDTACIVTVVVDDEGRTDEEIRKAVTDAMAGENTEKSLAGLGIEVTCIAGWDDPHHLVAVDDKAGAERDHDLMTMRSHGDTALDEFRAARPKI